MENEMEIYREGKLMNEAMNALRGLLPGRLIGDVAWPAWSPDSHVVIVGCGTT